MTPNEVLFIVLLILLAAVLVFFPVAIMGKACEGGQVTATEKLRELLDEHGIEWTAQGHCVTEWKYDGVTWRAYKVRDRLQIASMTLMTPGDAVAMTTGGRQDDRTGIRDWLESLQREELLEEAAWTREFLNTVAERCHVGDCKSLAEYVDKLECENSELRASNDDYMAWDQIYRDRQSELTDRLVQLENENAKLRELVRGLNYCTESADGPRVDCENCPLGEVEGKPLELMCEVMMQELGVEVDV